MTRSFRFLLYDTRWRLLTLVWECLFLAVFYAVTGGREYSRYGESIAALMMTTLMFLASTLGNCAAPNALSLGGRRIDIFWGIQGCALVYALCATLLTLAVNAITGVLGWPVLDLNLAVGRADRGDSKVIHTIISSSVFYHRPVPRASPAL